MRHVTRCLVAGLVALLPIAGCVIGIAWLEHALSQSWREQVTWYRPGLGMLLAVGAIYIVGLFVTTFLGRFLWRGVDGMLERLPLVGALYQSLKEVLGYDSARHRFFEAVVAVPVHDGFEIGLVTGRCTGPDGSPQTLVFVPSSPSPTNGRLLMVPPDRLRPLDLTPAAALRGLLSMGKTEMRAEG